MKRLLLMAVAGIALILSAPATAACQSPEANSGNPDYDDLVCTGLVAEEGRDYLSALRHYEKAAEVDLFESPNYALFSRIALTHYHMGDKEKALEYLEIARLSLSISIGRMKCPDNEMSPILVDFDGRKLTSRFVKKAIKIMCGEMYSYYYPARTFGGVIHDACLIQQYQSARRVIAPDQQD